MESVLRLQQRLLDWYDRNRRDLPWRADSDPYKIWISEIMLQQTRVDTVIPYFLRFIRELPDAESLAGVSGEVLMKLWEGLGYYSRAANLKKAAREIVEKHAGRLPEEVSELRKLPGIGPYTAGAIASMAFGKPVPAADGNVFRILARLTGSRENVDDTRVRKDMMRLLSAWIPAQRAGDFNQALMDLGAAVCLPNGSPRCTECPFFDFCIARLQGLTEEIPLKKVQKPRKVEQKTVLLIQWEGRIALQKRREGRLLKNLWELPNLEGWRPPDDCRSILEEWGVGIATIHSLGPAKHIFTHLEWRMEGFLIQAEQVREPERWTWASQEELSDVYSLPIAFRCYLEQLKTQKIENKPPGRPI